mmetsp:Transcript_14499/g.22666  ORF Transcript_14499/g.22666 Transcript_14499/m.22666 type:complete len:544 (-) Transcript_14499:18-1649(-)
MSSETPKCIAVGLDLGSFMARVAVCTDPSTSTPPAVVSNAQGHRFTPALIASEQEEDEANNSTTPSYVFGDAALRVLQKRKKDKKLHQYTIQHLVNLMADAQDGDDENKKVVAESSKEGVSAFFAQLCTMASDSSAVAPENLRIVLSVPTVIHDNEHDEELDAAHVDAWVETVQKGWKSLCPKTKSNKKKQVVVGLLTDAAAVCVAHGITDLTNKHHQKQYKHILVVDWGASGLTLTQFRSCGSSGMLQQVSSQRDTSLQASIFVNTLAKHVASQFERKNKFPSGEVFENSKARVKLISACETALKTMSNSNNANAPVHVTIDGLYEGVDCHIPISRPRWDMLCSRLLKSAQGTLESLAFQGDAVLVSGSVVSMPSAKQVVDKVFGNDSYYKGLSTIPPEEAVAMGCARQGAQVLELLGDHPQVDIGNMSKSPICPKLSLSPISLGLGGSTNGGSDDEAANMLAVLIDKGTPLPAHITHTFEIHSNGEKQEYGLYQTSPHEKLVAKLEELPETGTVEVQVELSTSGTLSISLQGGPLVRVGAQ